MYFPLGKYMTGPRASSLPGQRRRKPTVTRRWPQATLGGTSGLQFDAGWRGAGLSQGYHSPRVHRVLARAT